MEVKFGLSRLEQQPATRGQPEGFASLVKEERRKPPPAPAREGHREGEKGPPAGRPAPFAPPRAPAHLPLGLPQQAPEALVTQQPGGQVGVAAELGVLQALAQLAQGAQLLVQLPLPRPRRLEVQLQV